MINEFYAHSLPGRPKKDWQSLENHLRQVACTARSFAEKFKSGEWAYYSGLWHDLGKYSYEFQDMLLAANNPESGHQLLPRVDHSSAGARHASQIWGDAGKLMAYIIAGHHGGLPDGKNSRRNDLLNRLDSKRAVPDINSGILQSILEADHKPAIPFHAVEGRVGFQLAFFVRMLYSCLVDADFLDTEAFLDPSKAGCRKSKLPITDLRKTLFKGLSQFKPDTFINKKRDQILKACIEGAPKEPGLFTLTVPTGGGKTLSSLAFALRHAEIYQKDRVIYAIPFTSIIEQNAAVFRSILGEQAILEHHSNYSPESNLNDDDSIEAKRHRLGLAQKQFNIKQG